MVAVLRVLMSVVLVLGPTFYFGEKGDAEKMYAAAVAGALAAAIVNLDKIRRIKGPGGFEAEMRDIASEVYAKAAEVKKLAATSLAANIRSITTANRWGGQDVYERFAAVQAIRKTGEQLGIDDSEPVRDALAEFALFQAYDFFNLFRDKLHQNPGVPNDAKNAMRKAADIATARLPDKVEVESILRAHAIELTSDESGALEDYLFCREHRRPRGIESDA